MQRTSSTGIHAPAVIYRDYTLAELRADGAVHVIGANHIARTVMRLFDDGLRDEDMSAAKAVNLQHVG